MTRRDIPLVLGTQFRAQASILQAKLLAFRLDHLPAMAYLNLEDARPQGNLEPRLQEIILPMKALAQGDTELENTLAEFVDAMQAQIAEDRRNSLPALVLEAILSIHDEAGELSVKAIADRLNKEGTVKEHLDKPDLGVRAKRVGGIIRRDLQLRLNRSSEENSRRYVVQWDESRIAQLARRFCFSISQNNVSDVSVPLPMFQPNVSVSGPTFQSEAQCFSDVSASLRLEKAQTETSETSETSPGGIERDLRKRIFDIAQAAGFPRAPLRPGQSVRPGEDGWRAFCETAPPADLGLVQCHLNGSTEAQP